MKQASSQQARQTKINQGTKKKQQQQLQEVEMPYPKQSQAHLNILGKPGINKNIIYQDLECKRRMERLYLANFENKQKMFQSIQQTRLNLGNKEPDSNAIFYNQSKPNIFSIQFNTQSTVCKISPKRYSKLNLSNKLVKKGSIEHIEQKPTNSSSSPKDKPKQLTINPQVQLFKQYQFTPRLTRLDYTKPKKEVLNKYFQKFHSLQNPRYKRENDLSHLPYLSEVNHLQELKKYKFFLIQYENQSKYNIMPKINLSIVSDKKKLSNEVRLQRPKMIKKKSGIRGQKSRFTPWKYENINTIDVMENS